jgi:hypothetical protein
VVGLLAVLLLAVLLAWVQRQLMPGLLLLLQRLFCSQQPAAATRSPPVMPALAV